MNNSAEKTELLLNLYFHLIPANVVANAEWSEWTNWTLCNNKCLLLGSQPGKKSRMRHDRKTQFTMKETDLCEGIILCEPGMIYFIVRSVVSFL